MTNIPQTVIELSGLTLSFLELPEPESKFSMTLYVKEEGDALNLQLVYRRALFSSERAACILQQLHYLLEQIVAAQEKPIHSYSLVTPGSRSLLPDPRAVLPEPKYELVTTLFKVWATRTPEQLAVCQGDRSWTYGELAERTQTLASTLLAQGLKSGNAVAVLGPRSFGFIVSMLAVFMSGGVLLLIDRHLPATRQRLMLREARAKHLLLIESARTEESWHREVSPLVITRVDQHQGLPLESDNDLDWTASYLPVLAPDDPSYVFFTSGTTGVPKGVLGCHKGLAHFLAWQREAFAVGPQDRCAQLTSPSFDPVLRDVFLPLTSGGTLCLPEEDDELGADRILPWLEREQISLLHTVPTLAQAWLDTLPAGVFLRALRWVFFAGEPLTDALVHRWRQAFPAAGGIVNLYGPTEATLVKCSYQVPAAASPGMQPIGRPLPDTQVLVLEKNNQLCGIGEPGEIVLRTPFRSRGYINAPEEQTRRFMQNPFRDDPGDVLYFTGDRGRYRLDGTVEILGRLDHQVKIRGVRVEPDEVAAVLARHPGVRACVVLAHKDEQERHFLAAYVVPARPDETTLPALRAYLGAQLPAVMLPATFVLLDRLPFTLNGKVDRRALPVPDRSRPEPGKTFVTPRTLVEKALAVIWAEVLKLERISVHDNFFELGGHSLLATRVLSQLRTTFQVELPLRSFFEVPTVAGVSELIETVRWVAQSPQHFRGAPAGDREQGEL